MFVVPVFFVFQSPMLGVRVQLLVTILAFIRFERTMMVAVDIRVVRGGFGCLVIAGRVAVDLVLSRDQTRFLRGRSFRPTGEDFVQQLRCVGRD